VSYDIELPKGDAKVLILCAFEVLAIEIFGMTYSNFFSPAPFHWRQRNVAGEVRSDPLQQLWKGIVYVYAWKAGQKFS